MRLRRDSYRAITARALRFKGLYWMVYWLRISWAIWLVIACTSLKSLGKKATPPVSSAISRKRATPPAWSARLLAIQWCNRGTILLFQAAQRLPQDSRLALSFAVGHHQEALFSPAFGHSSSSGRRRDHGVVKPRSRRVLRCVPAHLSAWNTARVILIEKILFVKVATNTLSCGLLDCTRLMAAAFTWPASSAHGTGIVDDDTQCHGKWSSLWNEVIFLRLAIFEDGEIVLDEIRDQAILVVNPVACR